MTFSWFLLTGTSLHLLQKQSQAPKLYISPMSTVSLVTTVDVPNVLLWIFFSLHCLTVSFRRISLHSFSILHYLLPTHTHKKNPNGAKDTVSNISSLYILLLPQETFIKYDHSLFSCFFVVSNECRQCKIAFFYNIQNGMPFSN